MITVTMVALALATQGAADTAIVSDDAGFVQLNQDDLASAISHLEGLHRANPDDPAILINLASAYIDAGALEEAREAYRLAMESDERVQLELADGSWADSRHLAHLGMQRLVESPAWAMR